MGRRPAAAGIRTWKKVERVTGIEPALSAWEATGTFRPIPRFGCCDQEIRHLGSAAQPLWVENWVENAAAGNLCSLVHCSAVLWPRDAGHRMARGVGASMHCRDPEYRPQDGAGRAVCRAGTEVVNGLLAQRSGASRRARPVNMAWVKPVPACPAYRRPPPSGAPSSSEPIVSAGRPRPGLQPPMMTSAWRMSVTLVQSRRWPGW